MHLLTWLAQYEIAINGLWEFTLISMLVLFLACNLLPDRIVGNILPLHNVFRPRKNVDLDYQSIGYALLHTSWLTRITHYTIILDVTLWFVIFQSWHWGIPFIILALILIQSLFIGDIKFGIFFILVSLGTFVGAIYIVQLLGMPHAVLLSKVVLMAGGIMRMLGHTVQLMPPLLLNNTDRFEKLTLSNITWKIPITGVIGCIAEFSSGLPNRLFPVQVNYIYQTIFRVSPQTTLPWKEIEASASKVLTGGYSQLNTLENYYNNVTKGNDKWFSSDGRITARHQNKGH